MLKHWYNEDLLKAILECLYISGADFNTVNKLNGRTILHIAIDKGVGGYLFPLVNQCHCNINKYDRNLSTPLTLAIEKYGRDHDLVIAMVEELKAKEHSDETAEFLDKFSQQERYWKYAPRSSFRGLDFRKEKAERAANEQNNQLVAVEPVVLSQASISFLEEAKRSMQPVINNEIATKMAKAIISNASESMYSVFSNKLVHSDDKVELIDLIISECQQALMNGKVRNQVTYGARIASLESIRAACLTEHTAPSSTAYRL